MKKIFTILFFQIWTTFLLGQNISRYDSNFQLRLNSGYNFLLSDLSMGKETDHLIEFKNNYFYIEPSISYFFLKNIGAEFSLQLSGFNQNGKKLREFKNMTEPLYAENYYYSTKIDGDNVEDIIRWNFGILYRYETERFFIIPKISVGSTSFAANPAVIYLKEIDSNNELSINYIPDVNESMSYNFLTFGVSSYAGYKLSKKIFINLNLSSYYFAPEFSFEKRTTDLTTGEITNSEKIVYNKNLLNLGIG